jgi:hypothetical protein
MLFGIIVFGAIGATELIIILVILALPLVLVVYILLRYLGGFGYKACPHCAEKIKEAANVCRYCGRDVNNRSTSTV